MASIAQKMLLGAHGPGHPHIILARDAGNEAVPVSVAGPDALTSDATGDAMMSEANEKKAEKAKKVEDDKAIDKELKETFPASDPLSSTQPGSGITGTEPPPKGPSERATKES